MKRFFQLLMLVSIVTFSSCTKKTVIVRTPLPPGQAKKVTGSQSAASHAPGQVKKTTGSQSAAPYAPGQAKKANGSSSSSASSNSNGNGKGKKK